MRSGDTVVVITGKDKGKTGKIQKAFPQTGKIIVEGVAMVTASHNDNGWTGIKMGLSRPLTFGPEDMSELKEIVLSGAYETKAGGRYVFHADMAERYIASLTDRPKLKRKLKKLFKMFF